MSTSSSFSSSSEESDSTFLCLNAFNDRPTTGACLGLNPAGLGGAGLITGTFDGVLLDLSSFLIASKLLDLKGLGGGGATGGVLVITPNLDRVSCLGCLGLLWYA